jgi:hypothetical protein
MLSDGKSSHCLWQGELKTGVNSANEATYKWKVHNGKIEIMFLVWFLTSPHCQLRGVGQGMKQT